MTINVAEDFRIKTDKHCWILEARSDGLTREGEHKDSWSTTYHPTLGHVARKIMDCEMKSEVLKNEVDNVLKLEETMTILAEKLGDKITKGSESS